MLVGYIGNLFLVESSKDFNKHIYSIVSECKSYNLNFLVCSGGISKNYHTTLTFVEKLGKLLKGEGIGFRFIVGNTDLYYPLKEASANKTKKVEEILSKYRASEFYLPNNPIYTRNTRIQGFETWYDYSLYRGSPISLKDVTRKSKWFIKNHDVTYITSPTDYLYNLEDTYDSVYCKSTIAHMISKLENAQSRWGNPTYHSVVVMYFVPHKTFLGDGYLDKYFGTFKGSTKYGGVLDRFHVTDCIIGIKCRKEYPLRMKNTSYFNPTKSLEVIEYQ